MRPEDDAGVIARRLTLQIHRMARGERGPAGFNRPLRLAGNGFAFDFVLGGRTFRIVFLEPILRGILGDEHLEMILVANLLARIDVNPNSAHELSPTILFALCLF